MILAIVGMPGSGKTVASSHLRTRQMPVIRFGEIIVDEVHRRGLPLTPKNEEFVREELRRKEGMDVCARRSLPKLQRLLGVYNNVVIDGLYSFSEFKTLAAEFGDELSLIAIAAPRKLRYERLAKRPQRPLSSEEALRRDYQEIEFLEKGGPIAIADFTIVNEGTEEEFKKKLDNVLTSLGVNEDVRR